MSWALAEAIRMPGIGRRREVPLVHVRRQHMHAARVVRMTSTVMTRTNVDAGPELEHTRTRATARPARQREA